ncbi:MAG TPA: polysaccharide biosynthesis tyrosine autokinase [Ktedonosporobacter sp.]|nr:polysaccharide biosynthesis tyrosine autokinase [Ktedonosporobacter sp.]
MQTSLGYYITVTKRWAWVILLGIVLCGSATFIVEKFLPKTYDAKATLIVSAGSPSSSTYDMANATLILMPTYTNLVTNSRVMQDVAAKHTDIDLTKVPIVAKQQSGTENIDVTVSYKDPQVAAQIANDIATSYSNFLNAYTGGIVTVMPIPAVAPLLSDPSKPKPTQDALIGALAGLGLALAVIVIFEWVDDRLTSPDELQKLVALDALTIIPELSAKQRNKNAEETPELAEGCRILCASLNMAQAAYPFKMVMVTSALTGEGKSTIAANIASFLAMSGKRVLLVDADLRHPVLDQHFQLENRKGLSNAFLEMWPQVQVEMEGQPTEIPSLRVLTAGVLPSNPSELLQSHLAHQLFNHFRNSQHFDYIIFDVPPVLPVADAQILASYIQATVLVVDASKTSRKLIKRAKQILSRTGTRVLGIAVNKSQWPEYSDIQDYLGTMQQRPRADITISMPPNMPPPSNNRIDANHPNPAMLRSPNR